MHVLFVLPRFFPYRGGYEDSRLAIAKYLVNNGHQATVFTTVADDLESLWRPGFKTFPPGQFSLGGITIRRFPVSYSPIERYSSRILGLAPGWRWKAQYWRPSFHVPGLDRALRELEADVIHIGPLPHNGMMYTGLHAGELRKIPVVATPCPHFGDPEIDKEYLAPHQAQLLKCCDKVLCMTATERDKLQQLGITPSRMAIAPAGINISSVSGGNSDFLRHKYGVTGPVVLHLGMKAFDKGSQTVVEAMKRLWSRSSEAWLVMAGPSISAFDSYLAEAAGNCSRLLNLPAYGDQERRDLLASATVVVQPSRVESLGLITLEAWANRKPIIAADIPVSREIIASDSGVLVPFGDADRLAAAIDGLLHDSDARQHMGEAGYAKAQQYDSQIVCRRACEEIEQAVAGANGSRNAR